MCMFIRQHRTQAKLFETAFVDLFCVSLNVQHMCMYEYLCLYFCECVICGNRKRRVWFGAPFGCTCNRANIHCGDALRICASTISWWFYSHGTHSLKCSHILTYHILVHYTLSQSVGITWATSLLPRIVGRLGVMNEQKNTSPNNCSNCIDHGS